MVRKSKEQALATRGQLLDAAEQVFLAQGVAGTSLQQIAAAAGLTRGAIYWHFQDKAALFMAMMDRVTLPCECAVDEATACADTDPAAALQAIALAPLQALAGQPQVQRVFTIAMHFTEYIGELTPVAERHQQAVAGYVAEMQALCARLVDPSRAHGAALGLFALVDGLMRQWTLQPGRFDLAAVGRDVIGAYVAGLTAAAPDAPAAAPRKSPGRRAPST